MVAYTVVVGNLGNVCYLEDDRALAHDVFLRYVELSKQGYGRVSNEPVCLMEDGEPIREYTPQEED